MSDPTGWQLVDPSGIADLPNNETFISRPTVAENLGEIQVWAVTRQLNGTLCMRQTWRQYSTWLDGWSGSCGADLPEPPNTALTVWGGTWSGAPVLYLAYGGQSATIHLWRYYWPNSAWDPWVTLSFSSSDVDAIPVLVPRGGVHHAEALSILQVPDLQRSVEVSDSVSGLWTGASWHPLLPTLW